MATKLKPGFSCEHQSFASDICCCKDVPLVKQEFKDDCDINIIIERCLRNGAPLPTYEHVAPIYADITEMGDYRDMVERIRRADDAFMEMPAPVRARFDNDPGKLLDMLADPSRVDEAVELGLAVRREEPPAPEPKAAKPPVAGPKGKPVVPAKPVDGDSSDI